MYADWSQLTHEVVYEGYSPYMYVFELRKGDRENDICSNRGICDTVGSRPSTRIDSDLFKY
jgi:hypothetical protein